MTATLTTRHAPATLAPGRRLLAGLALALLAGAPTVQAEDSRLAEARACAAQSSRLARLHCYDALFRDRPDAAREQDPRAPLWRAVAAQEAERADDDLGLMVRETPDTVLMSAPALGTLPPRPLLVISCDAAITRFQLHLSEPLEAPRAPLRLQGAGVELGQTWRVLDGGHVLSGGRGLPAIATLKRLLGTERLSLASERPAIDGLRFDVSGLRSAIAPLRAMCRW